MNIIDMYFGIQAWMKGTYETINPAVNTLVNATVEQANKTASQIPTTPIVEAVKAAATETVSMSFWERMTTTASSTWGWGSAIVSNTASALGSIFKLGKHSVQAMDKAAQSGDLITTTFKNTLEYVDTIGIALYKGYLIISPQVLKEIFKAAEQRIKQNDESMEREHPVGWGVATLLTTAVTAYATYSLMYMLLRRSKNQNELSEITHELSNLIKVQNNRTLSSLVLNTMKTLGISATLFCVSAAVSLPIFIAAPIAALPVLTPVVQWLWSKHNGQAETSQLEEVVACAQMLQNMQEGIERARFNEQVRALLLKQAQNGDPRAVDRLYALIDKSITTQQRPELESESEYIARPPVIIHTKLEATAEDGKKQTQTAKNKRSANKA
jgi:hypothetical protein